MTKDSVVVTAKSGLHARPANMLIKTSQHFNSTIEIEYENKKFNAKSLIGILAAGIDCGAKITIICTGDDEVEACKAVTELIASGMGE